VLLFAECDGIGHVHERHFNQILRPIYMHKGKYEYMHICIYVCVYACMCVCMYVLMNSGMYVCMYVCTYVRISMCMYDLCRYVPMFKVMEREDG